MTRMFTAMSRLIFLHWLPEALLSATPHVCPLNNAPPLVHQCSFIQCYHYSLHGLASWSSEQYMIWYGPLSVDANVLYNYTFAWSSLQPLGPCLSCPPPWPQITISAPYSAAHATRPAPRLPPSCPIDASVKVSVQLHCELQPIFFLSRQDLKILDWSKDPTK